MATFKFEPKLHNMTFEIDQALLPLAEMQEFVDSMGLMAMIWEDPKGRPGQAPEDEGMITVTIGIPKVTDPNDCDGWENHLRKSEYADNPKEKLLALWNTTVQELQENLLKEEDIQAARCPDCGEWYSLTNEHDCAPVNAGAESEDPTV